MANARAAKAALKKRDEVSVAPAGVAVAKQADYVHDRVSDLSGCTRLLIDELRGADTENDKSQPRRVGLSGTLTDIAEHVEETQRLINDIRTYLFG